MNKLIKVLVFLPAVLFLVMGLRWLVAPAGVAPEFGLTLEDGLGLSTQVGDLSAFFLTTAICMLIGLVTVNKTWFYPPMILLSLTAIGRVIAWLIHDATLATEQIGVEIVVSIILLIATYRLPAKG